VNLGSRAVERGLPYVPADEARRAERPQPHANLPGRTEFDMPARTAPAPRPVTEQASTSCSVPACAAR